MSKKMQSNILLLITAFIWGSAFVAQKSGMDYIGPFTFNGRSEERRVGKECRL